MPKTVGLIPERKDMGVLAKFYGIAGNKIKDELLKISISDFTELEADKVTKKIDAIINSMNRFVIKWSNKAVKDAYKDSMDIARTSLSILGAVKDPLFNKKTHINAVKDGQEITAEDFIKANNSIRVNISTYIYLTRKAFQGMVQVQAFDLRMEEVVAGLMDEAITEGASRGQLDMLIRKHFHRALYEKKFININGRNYDLIKYAKMVSRTRLRTVQSEAVKNECEEYDNDLIQISDHGTETKICMEFEGNIYSISGKSRDYPKLPGLPPFHPSCLIPKTRILTNKGLVQIKDIKKGDMVFTHKGRFKPVLHVMKREFRGQLIWINGLGITHNHRMFTESGLIPAGNLTGSDKIYELSPRKLRPSYVSFNSNYFPSQRNKSFIPFSIVLNFIIMLTSVNFKINMVNDKIKNIFINRFFLNKINVKFFKYINSKFCHLRLIFQKIFTFASIYFPANNRIGRRIFVNHPDFIFPICHRIRIGDASLFRSADRTPFNSEMIKKFHMAMRGKGIVSKHFADLPHMQSFIVKVFNNFLQRIIEKGLNRFDFIKKFLSLSTSERAGFGIPGFNRISADKTSVHNDSFDSNSINNHSPYMLAYIGEVSNIEVKDDHSYVAEGFLVKNCMHSAMPTSEAAIEWEKTH